MRTNTRRFAAALVLGLSCVALTGGRTSAQPGDPAEPVPDLIGPPAPLTAEQVAARVPQVENAAERYGAIYALLEFVGMPTAPEQARERDAFVRGSLSHFAEYTRQAIEATRLPKCEFNVNFDALNPALFHLSEVETIDRLFRATGNEQFQQNNFTGVGESLAARIRLIRHLGGSKSLFEKRAALNMLTDPLRLIRAWSSVAADADRARLADELRKIDPNDPFDCRGGLSHMAKVILAPIAKRDAEVGLRWIEQLQPAKAMEFAQFCDNGFKEVIDAWVKPDGAKTIRAVIEGLNNFGQPHPLTGTDRFRDFAMQKRDEIAATIKLLTEPKPVPVP